jgi:hypothetical protein
MASLPGPDGSAPTKVPSVPDDRDDHDKQPEPDLHAPGQAGRVDDLDQVVRDEAAAVSRLPAPAEQVVLQGGKRAGKADQFHQDAVDHGRKLHPDEPRPAPGQE